MQLFEIFAGMDVSAGFSVNLQGNSPEFGYMVSKPGNEVVFKNLPTEFEIVSYALQRLELLQGHDIYIGGWMDDSTGLYYLDVSVNVLDLQTAIMLGESSGQIAIFDLSTFSSIYLNRGE